MKIKTFSISNYKGFKQSPEVEFGNNFNIIVGKNNSGKTAFLETFRLRFCENKPYRGINTNPFTINATSEFVIKFIVSGEEIREAIFRSGSQFFIPFMMGQDPETFLKEFLNQQEIELYVRTSYNGDYQDVNYPSHGLPVDQKNPTSMIVQRSGGEVCRFGDQQGINDTLSNVMHDLVPRKIYVFKPERFNIGTCSVQETDILEQQAHNLPSVLLKLQGNFDRFERFNNHVREIFPSIYRVVVVPRHSNVNVRIWMTDPISERDDLQIPLEECGTGIGQVLSILYVAMTRSGNVLVIDEPNSFLHPGAAKKLIEILKLYSSNQYIISTHASEIISISDPDTIHQIRWTGDESTIEKFDRSSILDIRRLLNDLGVSLQDVFGADKIVWVEGPTERECFPKILASQNIRTAGINFVSLRNTGDIQSKSNGKAIIDIYKNITNSNHLLPPTISINLDKENRSQKDIDDIVRISDGIVKFLPRFSYENYLIHADLLSQVISDEATRYSLSIKITDKQIEGWLKANGGRYYNQDWTGDLNDKNWLENCNAPKLLHDLFSEMTENTLEFRKTTHSIMLTQAILRHSPEKLSELITYIKSLL